MAEPLILIVTPSYNQGKYLEETILSVIGRRYPSLEFINMEGGSTGNSVDIIRKYKKHLTYWSSERNKKQLKRKFDFGKESSKSSFILTSNFKSQYFDRVQ